MNNKRPFALIAVLMLSATGAWAASPWAKPEPIPAEEAASVDDSATVPAEVEPLVEAPVVAEPVAADPAVAETPVQPVDMPQQTEVAAPVEINEPQGDTLTLPIASQVEAEPMPVITLDFPRRGMSEEKVQGELGRPLEIIPAVGQPPISRWVYNDRVVYFEYSTVIHAVAR